jgi:hypothetical protein
MSATFSVLGQALRKRIERLEELLELVRVAVSPAPPPSALDRQIFADIRDSGVLFPGPALDPTDIGPAINAAFAAGYLGVYIPPRKAFDGNFAWGCTTPVFKASPNDVSYAIEGCSTGGTYIQYVEGQPSPFTLGCNDGEITYRDLSFVGTAGNNTVCPNAVAIAAARTGRFIDCDFWGLACNADGTAGGGVAFSRADMTIFERCNFYGCDYRGTIRKGAVVSSTGMENGFAMRDCRFFASGVLNGVTYNKVSATQCWVWLGGQGEGDATRTGTYVACTFEDTWFANTSVYSIGLFPEPASVVPPVHAQFIVLHARVIGCGLTTPPLGNWAIESDFGMNVHIEDCDFYGSAGTAALKISNYDSLLWKNNTLGNGQKIVTFGTRGAGVGYVEFENPTQDLFLDDSAFSPANGLYTHNGFETVIYPGPKGIPGLLAMYDAKLGITTVGGNVSQWNEQVSGDPQENATQAVAGNRPAYNVTDPVYAGEPTLSFTLGTKLLQTGNWAVPPPNTGTIFFVGNFDNTATIEIALADNALNVYELYQNGADDLHFIGSNDMGVAGATPNLQNPHAWCFVLGNGANVASIRQDQSVTTNVTGNTGLGNPTGLSIGAQAAGANGLKGKIALILVYNRVLTGAELATVERYCASRYELIAQ